MDARIHQAVGRWSSEFGQQGIFTTDEHLVITSWNRWLERHSGRLATELVGQPLMQGFPDLMERGLDEHYRDALAGRVHLVSHLLHGYLLPMRTRVAEQLFSTMRQRAQIAPLTADDRVVGTITIIDDVTERAASEHELRKQIAAQQAARAAAEDAVRVKDEFLAMLGHELRNPLAPILTALQLLRRRGIDTIERERTIIERQVRHLVTLVNDLLDVSRITRGQITLRTEPIELAAVVAQAIEMVGPLVAQRGHHLTVDVPRSRFAVNGDPDRLAQVVANLITNAAKYTEPGGDICVSGRREGRDVVLRVRDTGIGLEAATLATIFEPFVQKRQTLERSQGGLGLGLAIARSLVELHGGSIAAASAGTARGSEFTIRLPRVRTVPRHVAQPSDQRPQPITPGTRVLIVDDNGDGALLLTEIMSSVGYDAKFALDGPSALRVAEDFEPHIAILDIGLPGMDGYELADRFISHPRLGGTRLVALTGYGQERDRRKATEAGFLAHLVKPVDVAQLLRVLELIRLQATGDRQVSG